MLTISFKLELGQQCPLPSLAFHFSCFSSGSLLCIVSQLKGTTMFTRALRTIAVLCLFGAGHAVASVLYVSVAGTNPVSPFSSWATAATNIQDAVDVANPGDTVLVTNGVYQYGGHKASISDVTNRVTVTNAVTVQSVNGPAVTIIQGCQPVGASNANNSVRCAFFESGGVLAGFTLTGGQAGTGNNISGGGFLGGFNGMEGVASNCVMTGNLATNGGGGGGGAANATLVNCVLANNQAGTGGGATQSTLVNCVLTGNQVGVAGGAYDCTLNNCTIVGNSGTNLPTQLTAGASSAAT